MLASNPLRAGSAILLCLLPLALGLKFTNDDFSIKPDEPFEVKWEGQAKDAGLLLRVIDADDDSAVRTYDVGINSSAKIVFSDEMESGKYYFQIQETASGQRATSETFRYDSDSESADTKDADVEQNDTKEGPKDDEVKEGKTKDDGTEEDDDSGSTSAKSATRAVAASATGLSALLALGLVFL